MPANPSRLTAEDRRTLKHLRELIEALDRRVPHIESIGEIQIARDAAAVRNAALERIREIEAQGEAIPTTAAARRR